MPLPNNIQIGGRYKFSDMLIKKKTYKKKTKKKVYKKKIIKNKSYKKKLNSFIK